MERIVECVPNFSEGRDRGVIDKITDEINRTAGVLLLDVDPGEATNRTVVTFAGEPDAVVEAAFRAIKRAAELIDMRRHRGAHPRIGATDVCPFVPVAGVTMDDCVELAKRLGNRVGSELGIPVYLYEYAATRPERRNLAHCRKGEYEGLKFRVGVPEWTPDFGPDTFNERAGATAVGARDFLIAWNINLNTRNQKLAARIANRLRERGYALRDETGNFIRDAAGNPVLTPGAFEGVKAVGWFIDEYDIAQVSINVTNHHIAPLHEIFDTACWLADEFGLRVTGSELVGLIPLDAVLDAGRYYLSKQGACSGVSEAELVKSAVRSLGLDQLYPFKPAEKIIEYRLRRPGRLTSLTVDAFADELASDSPAPGGGSVAALCGALSAALASMVANLTFGKKGYIEHNDLMNDVATRAQRLKGRLLTLVDKDTEAFNRVMAAFALPKKSEAERSARDAAIADATRGAAEVPFDVLKMMPEVAELALTVAQYGNSNLTPDAGVAGLTAALAARGTAYNVFVNLANLPDDDLKVKMKTDTKELLDKVDSVAAEVKGLVEGRLIHG